MCIFYYYFFFIVGSGLNLIITAQSLRLMCLLFLWLRLLHVHSTEAENVEEKLKKGGKSAYDLQVCIDAESDVSESRRKSPILR